MYNKAVSLTDVVKLAHNPELSEPYLRYICGIKNDQPYRHQEIEGISSLIRLINAPDERLSGFIYGYVVPQLNKEFDLLKITNSTCLNVELKSEEVSSEKMVRQLVQNRHYLRMLNKPSLQLYTYISSTNRIVTIDNRDSIVECSAAQLSKAINSMEIEAETIDLDVVYTPKNILVSPLNSPDRFLAGDYLLTENQERIKKEILLYINRENADRFIGLTGGPGTGKTLLIYDIARELAREQRVLIIHSGLLCEGHYELNQKLDNIRIIAAKEMRYREIRDVDLVIVDEAHRLYIPTLEKAEKWVKKTHTTCLFSFDAGQMLSMSEKSRNTSQRINSLCAENVYKMTNRIRTNKELALFITCLRDLSKYRDEYVFPNVKVLFEPNKDRAINLAKNLKHQGFTFISYTPSFYNPALDYQKDTYNTHNVIGQEFDGVCMLLDDNLFYTPDRKLVGKIHPNPDYLFEQLLYQGLTRVRSKLALIVMSEDLLQHILPLVKNN